jgi:energy-coupling factor transporter ATP-binding protein EcfA2
MKIRTLELENFRKFVRPVRVAGFADGLNVLFGPQEFGKSTILAAIRGVLFERYRSKTEELRRMQPYDSNAAPVLAMEFDLADGRYRIEKRFLHREPYARLMLPGGARLEGDPAEEELQRRLGFAEPGMRGASEASMGIWGALWVTQGGSVALPEMVEGSRRTIQDCLESEVGALAGGARGQEIRHATADELGKLRDRRGKPKGRYLEVLTQSANLRDEQLPALRVRQREIAAELDGLQRAEEDLRRATATDEDEADRKALVEAQAQRDAAVRLAEQLKAAEAGLSLAEARAKQAEDEAARRRKIVEAIEAAAAALAKTEAAQTDARMREAEAETEVAGLRAALAEGEARRSNAERTVEKLRALVDLARLEEETSGLEAGLKRAQAAQVRVNELSGQVDAIKVDQASMTKIRKAVRQQQSAQAALQALATRIVFEVVPAALSKVAVDGRPLSAPSHRMNVVDEARIEIAGIGQIAIQPVIKDRDDLDQALRTADREIERLLRAAGVGDPEEAETRHAERQRLAGEAEIAKAEVLALAPGRAGLDPGAAALAAHAERQRARLAASMAELSLSQAPDREEAERSVVSALAESEALSAQVQEMRGMAAEREAALREVQARSATAQANHGSAAADLQRRRREQEAAIASESDEALTRRRDAAREAQATAVSERERIARTTADANVALIEARIQRLTAKQAQRRDHIEHLRSVIQGHRIRIGEREGEGIDERIARGERELAQLEEEKVFLDREARVLELLDAELAVAERAAKERYMAPVVMRIRPYLQQLLPGAAIECDENFAITAIQRDGKPPELDRQSGGTQEQIAVLTRLAFAELLVDRGKPAAVILDDALVYSDPDRMERMFDILTHAARKAQIVILSCREALFQGLGAKRLSIEDR